MTLRCTRLVRDRLHLPRQTVPEPPPSTGRLGDWYVHLVRFGRPEFAIATSERSLLTVLFPARALRTTLAPNLRAAVGSLLESLGVSREAVAREIAAMESVTFGRATNRRVLGSMNELAFQASVLLARGDDLLTISRRLADTPMSAIGTKRGTTDIRGRSRANSSQCAWIEHLTGAAHCALSQVSVGCLALIQASASIANCWTVLSRPSASVSVTPPAKSYSEALRLIRQPSK